MAGRIQSQPLGFLNLFGLKTTGQAPMLMTEAVAPTCDVRKLYELQQYGTQRSADSFEGGGADLTAYFSAHQRNLRRVYALSIEMANVLNSTGNFVTFVPVLQSQGAATSSLLTYLGAPATFTATTTSTFYAWGMTFEQPLDVLPGSRLGFRMLDTNEGMPMPLTLSMLRTEIPV